MQKLSSPKIETRSTYDVATFENVIKKVRQFSLYPESFD
jgi:hypothetical protein